MSIECIGSITSGSNGVAIIFDINPEYYPVTDFNKGIFINRSITDGQIYVPGTAFVTVNKSKIGIVFPNINTTYGNDTYPWCTTSWLRLEWEIE